MNSAIDPSKESRITADQLDRWSSFDNLIQFRNTFGQVESTWGQQILFVVRNLDWIHCYIGEIKRSRSVNINENIGSNVETRNNVPGGLSKSNKAALYYIV